MSRKICQICGENRPRSMETHHIIPRRYGGSDESDNLVTLCSSCHSAVESIYTDDIWCGVGLEKEQQTTDAKPEADHVGEQPIIDLLDVFFKLDEHFETDNKPYTLIHATTNQPTEFRLHTRTAVEFIKEHSSAVDDNVKIWDESLYKKIIREYSDSSSLINGYSVVTDINGSDLRCASFDYEQLKNEFNIGEEQEYYSNVVA